MTPVGNLSSASASATFETGTSGGGLLLTVTLTADAFAAGMQAEFKEGEDAASPGCFLSVGDVDIPAPAPALDAAISPDPVLGAA